MGKVTCGDLYAQLLDRFGITGELTADIRYGVSIGFVSGLAEKVYLGSCMASMVRPGKDDQMDYIVGAVCEVYGLNHTEIDGEYWIYKEKHENYIHTMHNLIDHGQKNSRSWHRLRGILCGVPADELDMNFHERYEKK
jgi:hypothetical protein